MKDSSQWQKKLARQLAIYRHDLQSVTIRQLVDVELALYLSDQLLPGAPPVGTIPALLSGHPHPFAEQLFWTDAQQRAVQKARFLVNTFRHGSVWRELLEAYAQVEERFRGFAFVDATWESAVQQEKPSVCPDRFDSYEAALAGMLPLRIPTRQPAEAERDYVATVGNTQLHVRFPKPLPSIDPSRHTLRNHQRRVPLTISLDELQTTAQWMDDQISRRGLESGNWRTRVGRLQIDSYQTVVQQFIQNNQLTLDGATHMVGMLSAGKSTLMDVLAVWATQNGYRITLIVSDVSDVLRRCDFFHKLGLPTAPMLGKSSRMQHLARLHTMEGQPFLMAPGATLHRGFYWLSTACSLTALAVEDAPLPDHRRPCNALVREGEQYNCPLYGGCAYHNAQRGLVDARIWVGTSASMLRTSVDWQLTDSPTQFAELIYKNSDIVVVDEADRVQVQFDLAFSPGQTLANNHYEGWLDALVNHVRSVQTQQGRRIRSDSLVATFRRVLDTANIACEKLYDLLVAEPALHRWINNRHYFTGWLLFDHLADELIDERATTHPKLPTLFQSFLEGRDPLGEGDTHELSPFVRSFMATDLHRDRLRQQVLDWLRSQPLFTKKLPTEQHQLLLLKLEFTLLLSVLENRLNYIVKNWGQVETVFNLAEWGQNLFAEPPREYLSLVPMAPGGNVLAFRYEGDQQATPGRLSFFKNMGVGRQFLLNFHRLYEVDNVPGPHVLLLSGTSWAGTSPSYHLSLPVSALLRAPATELAGIGQSEFMFWPINGQQGKPIKVSGTSNEQQRHDALKELVKALVKKDSVSQRSQLEANWDTLPAERRRALFVVGSYREARIVRDYLVRLRPDWADMIVALERVGDYTLL